MKTIVFLAALLSCSLLSRAQTAPAPATGTTTEAAGTKNVGNDRADSPKAPGMQAATTTPTSATRPRGTKAARANGGRKKAASGTSGAPKQ